MTYRMDDPAFRHGQFEARYAPHIQAMNRLVDRLRQADRGPVPYIAPMHGGSAAGILSVMFRPDGSSGGTRSGFLSMENCDVAARQLLSDVRAAGVDPFDVSPWNVWPWECEPELADIETGAAALARIIELMPVVRVVVVQGVRTQEWWDDFEQLYPRIVCHPRLAVLKTYSSGWKALQQCSPEETARRKQDRLAVWKQAAEILNNTPTAVPGGYRGCCTDE